MGIKRFIGDMFESLYIGLSKKETRILPVNDEDFNLIGYLPQYLGGYIYFDVRLQLKDKWYIDRPVTLDECKKLIDEFHIEDAKSLQKKYRAGSKVIKYP